MPLVRHNILLDPWPLRPPRRLYLLDDATIDDRF
jgi:hypothetical protein